MDQDFIDNIDDTEEIASDTNVKVVNTQLKQLRFSTVANILSKKKNIEVHLEKKETYTESFAHTINNREITIVEDFPHHDDPVVSFIFDKGKLFHELCHVIYTRMKPEEKMELAEKTNNPDLFGALLNILEDGQAEKKLKDEYPGTEHYIDSVLYELAKNIKSKDDILNDLAFRVRKGHYIIKENEETLKPVETLINKAINSRNTREVAAYAKQITDIISSKMPKVNNQDNHCYSNGSEDAGENKDKNKQSDKQNTDNNSGNAENDKSEKQDKDTDEKSKNNSSASGEEESDGSEKAESDGEQNGDTNEETGGSDKKSSEGKDSADQNKNSSSDGSTKQNKAATGAGGKSTAEQEAEKLLEEIMQTIYADAKDELDAISIDWTPESGQILCSTFEEEQADTIFQMLNSIKIEKGRLKFRESRKNGVLDSRKLPNFYTDNSFLKVRQPTDSAEFGVAILIDASGSMGGSKIDTALSFGRIFNSVFQRLKVEKLVYTFQERSIRDHSVCVPERFRSGGNTPTGEAMKRAIDKMKDFKSDKRFLLILTDGAPNNAEYVETQVKEANNNGIEVIVVGIETSNIVSTFCNFSTVLQDNNELFDKAGTLLLNYLNS